MFGVLNFVTILLIAAGWCLITLAARDIFVTARLAATVQQKNTRLSIFYHSLSYLIITKAYQIIRCRKWLRIFSSVAGVLLPILQFLFWKVSFIVGFAFLYLAVNLKLGGEIFADKLFEDFFSALWLSFTISVRFAPYNINSDEMLVYLIANIQFYLGFPFYGFICFYILTLGRKARRLQPFLYGLKNELKKSYSPFHFSTNLKESYRAKEIILILQNWELWAEELRNNLISCPPLIYNRSFTKNWTWLASLNIILDTSAALIVTSNAAIEFQARRTFASARHTLVGMADCLKVLPPGSEQIPFFQELPSNYEDDILSAEIIYDVKESSSTTKEIEMLLVWQFTYQSSLSALSDYLDVELPSRKGDSRMSY